MKFRLTDLGESALDYSRFGVYNIIDNRFPWSGVTDEMKSEFLMDYVVLREIKDTGTVSRQYYKAVPDLLRDGLIEDEI
jgi:hypothetical protein